MKEIICSTRRPVRSTAGITRRAFALLIGVSAAFLVAPLQATESRKIVIYGGTGNIGQRIVREALDRGHRVRVIVRNPSRMTLQHERLTVTKGDVRDSAQVVRDIDGWDVVVNSVSFRGKNPDHAGYRKAAEALVASMRALGDRAPYLIVVGGAGSLEVEPGVLLVERIPPKFRGEALGQKDALEYYRTVPDVSWTYFSPAERIEPGQHTGRFRLGDDRLVVDAEGGSRISIEDYAVALIDEAEKPAHIRKRFTIGY